MEKKFLFVLHLVVALGPQVYLKKISAPGGDSWELWAATKP